MDEAWIERWREEMRTGARRLLATFEARAGFPPGGHEISGPATAAELAGLAELHGEALPAGLVAFYRVVAEVQLPDVGNGYWLHRPPLPGEDPGFPRLLSDGRAIVVFGTDGGGALYALPAGTDAPVLRLADGEWVGAAYDADCAAEAAPDLTAFLAFLRHELGLHAP